MAKPGTAPNLNVCIRGEKYATNRYRYHQIGSGWTEDNGISITIEFGAAFTLTPGMRLRVFEKTVKDSDEGSYTAEENF